MSSNPSISIAPSILSADWSRLGEEVRAVTKAGAHLIHVDVMDGHFVPNITLGPDIVAAIQCNTLLPLDVHLMIERPEAYIDDFVNAGANIVTVHAEACVHLHRVLQQIREKGVRAGVALNPATPLSTIKYVLDEVDLILIMTVNPGFGGQKPIPAAIEKIRQTRKLVAECKREKPILIEVDGGVKVENAQDFAVADVFVAGSGIFKWPEAVEALKKEKMDEAALTESYGRVIGALLKKLGEARAESSLR